MKHRKPVAYYCDLLGIETTKKHVAPTMSGIMDVEIVPLQEKHLPGACRVLKVRDQFFNFKITSSSESALNLINFNRN